MRRRPGAGADRGVSRTARLALLAAIASAACAPRPPAPLATYRRFERPPATDSVVRFRGRDIDIRPYVEDFPYHGLTPQIAEGQLLYLHEGERRTAGVTPLGQPIDLAAGTALSHVDLAGYGMSQLTLHRGTLLFRGRRETDVESALYRLAPGDSEPRRLIAARLVSWRLDRINDRVAAIVDGDSRCLELIDLASLERRTVHCGTPELHLSPGPPSLRPDGSGVVFELEPARARPVSLGYVALNVPEPSLEILTTRPFARPLARWLDNDRIAYLTGGRFGRVDVFDLATSKSTPATALLKTPIQSARVFTIGGRSWIVTIGRDNTGSDLTIHEPETTAAVAHRRLAGSARWLDAHDDRGYLITRADPAAPAAITTVRLIPTDPEPTPVLTTALELPTALRRNLSACRRVHVHQRKTLIGVFEQRTNVVAYEHYFDSPFALVPLRPTAGDPIVLVDFSSDLTPSAREAHLLCEAGLTTIVIRGAFNPRMEPAIRYAITRLIGDRKPTIIFRCDSSSCPPPDASIRPDHIIERERLGAVPPRYGQLGNDIGVSFAGHPTDVLVWPGSEQMATGRLRLRSAERDGSRLDLARAAIGDLFALLEEPRDRTTTTPAAQRAAEGSPARPSLRRSSPDDY